MVCSVGTVASTGVVTVIPFINNYADPGLSTELGNLAGWYDETGTNGHVTSTWGWRNNSCW